MGSSFFSVRCVYETALAESIARDLESQGEWPVEEDDELDLEDDGVIPERFPYLSLIHI